MRHFLVGLSWLALCGTAMLQGCAGNSSTAANTQIAAPAIQQDEVPRVEAALARYRQLVMATDSAGIARLCTADASVSHGNGQPTVGREAIEKFLQSFAAYQVQSYELVARSTQVTGPRALQRGRYAQRVRLPNGQVVEVAGQFEAQWQMQTDGSWLLARMHTESI